MSLQGSVSMHLDKREITDDDKFTKGNNDSTATEDLFKSQVQELWERDALGDCYVKDRDIQLQIGGEGGAASLLSLCRVASCQTSEELTVMKQLFTNKKETTTQTKSGLVPELAATLSRQPFSFTNEIDAMRRLQSVTAGALQRYDTSLSQDDASLREDKKESTSSKCSPSTSSAHWWDTLIGNSPFGKNRRIQPQPNGKHGDGGSDHNENNTRNAIIARRGEKRVLQHYFNLACMCLEFLKEQQDGNGEDTAQDNADFDAYTTMLGDQISSEEVLLA
jgi:hypothetical protein